MDIIRPLIAAVLLALLLPALVVSARAAEVAESPDMAVVDRYVEEQLATLGVPGAALAVVQRDGAVHLRGFGRADDTGRAMTAQTPLLLGSLTKSFTAVAVMQLVEQGRVELDAPVRRYIPWFRVADPAASAQITVRHLLTHTSGLSGRGEAGWLRRGDGATDAIERLVRALADVELTAQPGTTWQYASANYVVLGLLVEVVSGAPYERYVQEQIFAPLGMAGSFASPEVARAAGLAEGHQFWFGRARPAELPYPRGLLAAGYLASSAEDMGSYLHAHLNGGRAEGVRILSPAGFAELHRPGLAIDDGLWTGMGWGVGDFDGARVLQHDGNTGNYRAEMWLLPEQGLGFVLLMNASNELQTTPTRALGQGIAELLLGREPAGVALNPVALGFYSVVMVLVGLQLLVAARSIATLRRWSLAPPRPNPWRHVWLPLAGGLLAALVFLAVVPGMFLGGRCRWRSSWFPTSVPRAPWRVWRRSAGRP
jgi:CubicO group peptidase (beta-lactamase class C family)